MKVITQAGDTIELGATEAAPRIGIIDYSRRSTDDFGVTTVVERGFARRVSARIAVPFAAVDTLHRRLAELRATSARWVASDRLASLSVTGFFKDFEIDLAVPPLSYCTLTIEGLASSDAVADNGVDAAPDGQASTLTLLQPTVMTDATLVSSSVGETDAPQWVADTSYAKGARVIRSTRHRIYESLIASNVGNDPGGASGKWLDVGPTNRWAMFDQALGTSTTSANPLTVTMRAGTVNAVALLDVAGATVRTQASGYDRTLAVGAGAVSFLDIPATMGDVTVTVSGGNQISVGTLLIGRRAGLGITEASPTAGITDFSRKAVDDFGEVTIVKRPFAKRMSARALIRTDAVDVVASRIAAVRARPSLWIGQSGLESLTIYGFFKDFEIEVGESVSKLSLSIEGLSAAPPAQSAFILVDRGAWDAAASYKLGDVVLRGGSTWRYIAASPSTGNAPPDLPVEETAYWRVLAKAGTAGVAGANAITALLTNESHTVAADAAGVVTSYAGATGAFRIYSGSAEATGAFTLATADNPQGLAVSYSGQTYTITGGLDANEDSAVLTIRATGSGAFAGVTVDKVFSLAKSRAGASGAPAKLLTVTSTSQTLTVSSAGALDPAGAAQNVTFTALRQNTTAAVTWTARDQAGNVTNNFAGASVTIAAADLLTIINNAGPNARSMTMTASLTDGTTLSDTISVAKVQAGAQGNTGASAVTALLTNESHTLPALTDGTVVSYSGATGAMRVYAGAADVTGAFALSTASNPQALSASYSGQSYTVTAGFDANEENATLTIRATGSGAYAGVTIDKVFTLAKSKTGTPGNKGADAKTVYATSTSQTVTVSAAGAIDPPGAAQDITFTAIKQNTTAAVTWSLQDQNGTTTNNYQGDSVTLSAQSIINAIANAGAAARSARMVATLTDGAVLSDTISIAKVQAGAPGAPGLDGAPALTGLLSNESHTLPALTDGTVTSYAGATGAFRIFAGAGDVSGAFTLSTASNPQALTVSYSDRTYTVTAGFDANEENATLVIRATGSGAYAGVTVDKVFSLAKSKTGSAGVNAKLIYASSTSQTLTVSSAGALDPAGTAQNITFTATKQNTTAAVTWVARNQAGTVTNNFGGDSVTIAAGDLLTIINSGGANARSMTMTATLSDGATLSDTISVAKIAAGAAGDAGAAATGIVLTASPTTIRYTSTGAIVAADVSFTATRQNTAAPTRWILRNHAGESLFEGFAADFVNAESSAWSSASGDQLTRKAATLAGLMAVSPGNGGFIMEARVNGTTISQRATIAGVRDGPQGQTGTSAPQPVKVESSGTTMGPILLQPNGGLAASAQVGVQANAGGDATLQVQYAFDGGGYSVAGSASGYVGPGEPTMLNASGSVVNSASTARFVTLRVALTGPSGTVVRGGTTNFIQVG